MKLSVIYVFILGKEIKCVIYVFIFQGKKSSVLLPQPVTWQGLWCQCIELYTGMLATLKYSFLEDTFNFVGCHQDRLQQVHTNLLFCLLLYREFSCITDVEMTTCDVSKTTCQLLMLSIEQNHIKYNSLPV